MEKGRKCWGKKMLTEMLKLIIFSFLFFDKTQIIDSKLNETIFSLLDDFEDKLFNTNFSVLSISPAAKMLKINFPGV